MAPCHLGYDWGHWGLEGLEGSILDVGFKDLYPGGVSENSGCSTFCPYFWGISTQVQNRMS